MEENRRKWHINREVSVGDALALIMALTAVLIAYFAHDTRIALLEQSQITWSQFAQNAVDRLERTVNTINDKLDRLIERELKK